MDDRSFMLGLLHVRGLGEANADAVVGARERGGPFRSLADAMERSGLRREAVESLVAAGAFDAMTPDRRSALWEAGLLYQPVGAQKTLRLPVEQDMAQLPMMTGWETMLDEYRTMGVHPGGHFMSHMRERLPGDITPSHEVTDLEDGAEVTVAGLVIRRQHPNANAVFVTLEDEFGHVPLVIWPQVFERYRLVIREPVLKVRGFVSRREGTLNVVARHIEGIPLDHALPPSKNWG